MSLNPCDLNVGDRIVFGGCIVREVTDIELGSEETYILDRDVSLKQNDPLWELAELTKPELPFFLCLSMLDDSCESYMLKELRYSISPSRLLNRLRKDVKSLEAAGVKEEQDE